MQSQTIALVISTGKLTAQTFKSALSQAVRQLEATNQAAKQAAEQPKQSKQTVKELLKQGTTAHVDLPDNTVGGFQRIARKYGVNFAIEKVKSDGKTKYVAFFQAKDAEVLNAAFAEYLSQNQEKSTRPSLRQLLARAIPKVEKAEPKKAQEMDR